MQCGKYGVYVVFIQGVWAPERREAASSSEENAQIVERQPAAIPANSQFFVSSGSW